MGVVRLGRMGSSIARRLHRAGHHCVVYNRTAKPVVELAAEGLTPASDISDLVKKFDPPRAVWLMLPAGTITEGMVDTMSDLLSAGDRLFSAWAWDSNPRPRADAARPRRPTLYQE